MTVVAKKKGAQYFSVFVKVLPKYLSRYLLSICHDICSVFDKIFVKAFPHSSNFHFVHVHVSSYRQRWRYDETIHNCGITFCIWFNSLSRMLNCGRVPICVLSTIVECFLVICAPHFLLHKNIILCAGCSRESGLPLQDEHKYW